MRLFRGDLDAETVYDERPVEIARRFELEGARRLHVVDLDAATGEGSNRELIQEICRSVAIPVQVGGGLRTIDAISSAIADGAARVVLGTAAISHPGFVAEAVNRVGLAVAIAIDVRDGRVMTHGWREEGSPLDDVVSVLAGEGAPRFIVTSIMRDGTMDGPDLELYERMRSLTDRPVVASGGIRTAADVWALRDLGLEACVVGKAMYSGTLSLSEVVRG